jgi:hypothetical protein
VENLVIVRNAQVAYTSKSTAAGSDLRLEHWFRCLAEPKVCIADNSDTSPYVSQRTVCPSAGYGIRFNPSHQFVRQRILKNGTETLGRARRMARPRGLATDRLSACRAFVDRVC